MNSGIQKNNSLTEEEKIELEIVGNPQVQYTCPSGGVWSILFGQTSISKRRKRFVELRTKLRMSELEINPSQNYNEYLKIKTEEEERFSNIFEPNSDRAIDVRTKRRMLELDLNFKKDYQEYYRIRKEEEKRFKNN